MFVEKFNRYLMQGAKRSLFDSNTGTVMEEAFKRDTLKALKEKIAGTGQVPQKKILDEMLKLDLSKKWYEGDPCFAAGTLVHTKDGLKPIEQIQVGDWVLSKHESGEGEQAHKQVTKTFVHDDAEVMLLNYQVRRPDDTTFGGILVVTPNHPFWVPGKGWKKAEALKATWPFMPLEVFDEKAASVYRNTKTYVSASPTVAWVPSTSVCEDLMRPGKYFDLESLKFIMETDSPYAKSDHFGVDIGLPAGRPKNNHRFKTTVYNFEVEDFHTYYVGKDGVWVHNKNMQVNLSNGGVPLTAELENNIFRFSSNRRSQLFFQ